MKISSYIRINGIVQGVGMRPFIYRLATELGLKGTVKNSSRGVEIYVTGEDSIINEFLTRIRESAPSASKISEIIVNRTETKDFADFSIILSSEEDIIETSISPDIALCADCRAELLNPEDRRFLYPFINCTNCGPRYSIIRKIPYDRPNTTMKDFVMCSNCSAEYHSPSDRRFHAQPDACPVCGPQVFLLLPDKRIISSGYEAIRKVKEFLKEGKIVAIKGLGGFHIACNARNKNAVNTLRERKRRSMKPFAIMVPDISAAEKFAVITDSEKRLLSSPQSPIVLLKKSDDFALPEEISYQNERIGIMLPYTPLHTLLFFNPDTGEYDYDALVMTSGNISDLPIEFTNDDAFEKLHNIADCFLVHNRDIYNRIDDSITYIFENNEILLRRARGYVPVPVITGKSSKESVVATGAELKGCFALNRDRNIILSQHMGDLKTEEGLNFFIHTYNLLTDILRISPSKAILDKHPNYLTREIVRRIGISDTTEVQHHYAHICSVLFENDYENDVIGFAFDGTGYGDDGAVWGSEAFFCNIREYKRVGHLKYTDMAGGDSASELCYIPAISYLISSGIEIEKLEAFRDIKSEEIELLRFSLLNRINLHRSSSMGRLFDAVAFLTGIRTKNSFEGEAAMALEYIADKECNDSYEISLTGNSDCIEIDIESLLYQIQDDLKRKTEPSRISSRFHNWISDTILRLSVMIREKSGTNTVALSGGVFQNRYLLYRTIKLLRKDGFEILINRRVPPNDGGISFGQMGHYICSKSS